MRNCFAIGKGAKYREQCVCMSVFLLAYLKTIYPNFTKFSVNVTYGRGSVLVSRRSDMLRTSYFIYHHYFICPRIQQYVNQHQYN